MQLTEVRINLCGEAGNRLKAFCSLTFDDTFVIRDAKLIEGHDGPFLAMPSRKLMDRCTRCGDKNHLRARFCNNCGSRLNENRHLQNHSPASHGHNRLKLHADIAHPINAQCREALEEVVIRAYFEEIEKSKQPGYIPPRLEGEEFEMYTEESPRPVRPCA
jgi:stage V sporulation protein G